MNIKKTVLRMVPYECIALYGTKIGQAWRDELIWHLSEDYGG